MLSDRFLVPALSITLLAIAAASITAQLLA